MRISVHFIVFFLWVPKGHVSSANTKALIDYKVVKWGDSLVLNCTYNCSSGFTRGSWRTESDISDCNTTPGNGSFCTVSICLSNISTQHIGKNYSCYTEAIDDPKLTKQTVRIIFLRLQARDTVPNWTRNPNIDLKNTSLPAEHGTSNGGEAANCKFQKLFLGTSISHIGSVFMLTGEFNGMKVLAAATITVATVLAVLAVFLCINRNRHIWNGERVVSRSYSHQPPNAALQPVKGMLSTQSEKIILRIPPPENEGDTEVPYADIMITVRGVSTPELTQVGYLGTGEWRGDESRCHLQASRSADRLHVPQPREVSRKMSTNSEYAVITYA
ncbi:uncharacterized protein LOC124884413 isoform X2 [Girardinichthys multiradiatus]|uniref:uncharacterized protein LOC124884413 isoform X2 n=1 Tax=Girardinichthys multiradiatus TaxID=208333 RepID=UPI001FAC3F2D|nr:uncharacterized protein LOC124884413 isoform X2 [Girardinichthys multiradiatus]